MSSATSRTPRYMLQKACSKSHTSTEHKHNQGKLYRVLRGYPIPRPLPVYAPGFCTQLRYLSTSFRDNGRYQPLPRKELSDPRQLVALLKTEVTQSKKPPHHIVLSKFQEYKNSELFNPIVVAASFNYMVKGSNRQQAAEVRIMLDGVE